MRGWLRRLSTGDPYFGSLPLHADGVVYAVIGHYPLYMLIYSWFPMVGRAVDEVDLLVHMMGVIAIFAWIHFMLIWRADCRWRDLGWRSFNVRWLPYLPLIFLAIAYSRMLSYELVGASEAARQSVSLFSNGFNFEAVSVPDILLSDIAGPVMEETVFRGILFAWLRGHASWIVAALLSGIADAAIHLEMDRMLPLTVAFVGYAWIYERTRSIWPSALLHGTFNFTQNF